MKIWKKWLILISLVLFCLPLSGCALINVNPERDNAQVIATIDGEDIYKSEFNNYMALVQMNYDAANQDWPTGSALKTLKNNLYDSIIQQTVFALKAEKDGETVDEEAAKKDADERFTELQEELGQDKFENILSQNYSDNDTFKAWLEENTIQSELATKTTDKFEEEFKADPSKVLDEVVGKINDTDVTRGEYEYYLVGETLNYYLSNQSALPTDEESMKETNLTIFENIEKQNANIAYAEENDIDVTQEEIDSAASSLSYMLNYFFQEDDQLNNFLQSYYLDKTTYDKYQQEQAKGNAAQTAISDKIEEDVEVSESAISKYYNDNIKKYDTSEVSAMHILADNKDAADAIYDEARNITTKDDFQTLIDKYQDVEGISEATDLGSFDYATMVEEFSNAAFNADVDTVVGPVETPFGYHIIYVYDKEEGETQSLEDVKDEIETTLKQEQGQEEFDALEEKLTSDAKYDIPDVIETPLEEYASELEQEYNVTRYENKIKA